MAAPIRGIDPTRTITLRRAFESAMARRFAVLRKAIVDTVVVQDALGLKAEFVYNHSYASTQANLSQPEIIARIKRIQRGIDKRDIIKLEDVPHITVRYGLHEEDPNPARLLIAGSGQIWVRLGRLSLFSSEKQDVLKIDVSSDRLNDLNSRLGLLPNTQTFSGYTPHLTIAYLKPGTGRKYVNQLTGLEGLTNVVTSIAFSDKERNHTPIALNMNPYHDELGRFTNGPSVQKGKYYKRPHGGDDSHQEFEGPFESVHDAWMHSYATGTLDTRKSDSEKGIIVLKDGRAVWVARGEHLAEDIYAYQEQEGTRKYHLKKPSKVKFPEYWPLKQEEDTTNGGQGSGNFDHAGRPGQVGGSQSGVSYQGYRPTQSVTYDASRNTYTLERSGDLTEVVVNPHPSSVRAWLRSIKNPYPGEEYMPLLKGIAAGGNVYVWEPEFSQGFPHHSSVKFQLELDKYDNDDEDNRFVIVMEDGHVEVRPFGLGAAATEKWARDHGLPVRNSAPVNNSRWAYQTSLQKLAAFRAWLQDQMKVTITSEDNWWETYVEEGYRKGAKRAVDDVTKTLPQADKKLEGFKGTQSQFIQSSFGRVVPVEKVKMLASRVFSDLDGITDYMETRIVRALTDGLTQGQHPNIIAEEMVKTVAMGLARAKTISRTEIIRSHAEGQLDALERLGVQYVGVTVEWSTAGDGHVCPKCRPLEGIVLTTQEARGMLPRHANCRCTFKPAGMIDRRGKQIKDKNRIEAAIAKSLGTEKKMTKSGMARSNKYNSWVGAKLKIAKNRPKTLIGR